MLRFSIVRSEIVSNTLQQHMQQRTSIVSDLDNIEQFMQQR